MKKATFFCLNRMSGEVAWSRNFPGEWWVGVEAVTKEAIVLHGFAAPDMPIHKGITVVDLPTGKPLWEHPDLSFEGMGANSIVGSLGSHGNKRYTSLDFRSGHVLREWNEEDPPMRNEQANMFPDRSISFPVTKLDAGTPAPPVVRSILSEHGESTPVSWIQTGSSVVISTQHPVSGNRIEQVLSVRQSENDEEVFTDRIATDMFVPDSFLVQDQMLYYVRARKDLVAVNLETVTKGGMG